MNVFHRRLGIGGEHQAAIGAGLLDDVVTSDVADESHVRRGLSHVSHGFMIADTQADQAVTSAGERRRSGAAAVQACRQRREDEREDGGGREGDRDVRAVDGAGHQAAGG